MEKRSTFCIRCDGHYLERFASSIEAIQKDNPVDVLKSFETIGSIFSSRSAVLLVTVRSLGELQELVTALIPHQVALNQRTVIVVVVQSGLNEKQEKLLMRAGCKDILSDRADLRGLQSKITRYLKITEQNLVSYAESSKPKMVSVGSSKSKVVEGNTSDIVTFVEPIELKHDYWIVSNKRPAQRNMGRWIVSAIGPSPAIGAWTPLKDTPHCFAFKIYTPAKHDFHSTEGNWVFHGAKPEFSFELGRWNFVGNDPRLEWVGNNGATAAVRFWHHAESKKMMIASNSKETTDWMPRIEATFDRDYRFREEQIVHQDHKAVGEDSKELEAKFGSLVSHLSNDVVRFLKEAKEKLAPKPQMFSKLEDKKQINKFFDVAGEYQDRGILWLSGRVFLSDLRVHDVNIEKGVAEVVMMPPVLDPLAMVDEGLKGSGDRKVYVNLKLLETSLFFYADREQITCEDGVLNIPIPSFAYEVQRRGGVRLSNSPKIPGLALIKIPPTAKGAWKIIDISPGGLGLEMAADSFAFSKDRSFKIELTVQNEKFDLICMPKWFKTDERGMLRMGAQFEHMSPVAHEKLELYIMEKHLERIRQGSK